MTTGTESLPAAQGLPQLEATLAATRLALDAATKAHTKAHEAWKAARIEARPEEWVTVRLGR